MSLIRGVEPSQYKVQFDDTNKKIYGDLGTHAVKNHPELFERGVFIEESKSSNNHAANSVV